MHAARHLACITAAAIRVRDTSANMEQTSATEEVAIEPIVNCRVIYMAASLITIQPPHESWNAA